MDVKRISILDALSVHMDITVVKNVNISQRTIVKFTLLLKIFSTLQKNMMQLICFIDIQESNIKHRKIK